MTLPPNRIEAAARAKIKVMHDIEHRIQAAGIKTEREIAQRFGVARSMVHKIISHQAWTHLP